MLPALGSGSLLGERFELIRLLDKGGMGAVWEARDRESGTAVAVKVLHHALADARVSRRFLREARALEQLDNEHVVKILSHGVSAAVPFIVMELLQGESLRALLEREGPLPPRRALDILSATADGLTAAHAHGIVHRDVKPSNLFLCGTGPDWVLKVVDFGIATGDSLETASQGSSTGFIGSPAYMSPEQARGEKVDPQTDVWSLAVVAFQMLTGREPFGGANVPDILQRICSGPIPLPSSMASGLAPALDEVFVRAFSRTPAQRFRTARELVVALSEACAGAANLAAKSLAPEPRKGRSATTASYTGWGSASRARPASRALRLAMGGVLIGMVGIAGGLLLARRAPSSPPLTPVAPTAARASVTSRSAPAAAAPEPRAPALPGTDIAPPRMMASSVAAPRSAAPFRPKSAIAIKPSPSPAPSTPDKPAALDPVFGLAVESPHAREASNRPGADAASGDPQLTDPAAR